MSLIRTAIAGILSLLAAPVSAQQFPTVPDHTVIGRIGGGGSSGPSQAIPFTSLNQQVFNSLCQTNNAFPVYSTSASSWICSLAPAANKVYAGPSTGPAAQPTFRSLVAADVPALSALSGNLLVTQLNSGTGASSSTFWRGDGTWAPAVAAAVVNVIVTAFPNTATYTANANLVVADVECVGSGGGGGGTPATSASQVSAGAGGGAGGYARGIFSAATIGASQTVTVGAAGTSGSGVLGGTGGNVTFGALLTANGGVGGPLGILSTTSTISGGASGGTGTGGYLNLTGQTGYDGWAIITGSTSLAQGGPGGSSVYGGGGTTAMIAAGGFINGVNGVGSGSGGSGGSAGVSAGQSTGGTGTKGMCVVREFVHG